MEDPRTWLRVIGEFAVGRDRRQLTDAQVGSRKARTLLAALAVENGQFVNIEKLVDVVWDGAPPRRPTAYVATLVSRLRSVLGTDAIVGGSRGYRLGPAVAVDLFAAATRVEQGEMLLTQSAPDRALPVVRSALAVLCAGDVLHDQPHALWAEGARIFHAGVLRRARHAVADAALATGDVATARVAAEAAVAADPIDEVAHRALMHAYHAGGEPIRAVAAYRQLRATLATELGVSPTPPTSELHVAILTSLDGPDRQALPRLGTPNPRYPAAVTKQPCTCS
jgi:DNA-binding SARP family transcriptional activator